MHSNVTFWLFLAGLFLAGLAAFGIGSYALRRIDRAAAGPKWPALVDESLRTTDSATRRDMIERLAMVDSPWSRGVLETARKDEPIPELRALIDAALSGR